MAPTTAQKASKYTPHVSFFPVPSGMRLLTFSSSHPWLLHLVDAWCRAGTRSTEYLFVVELYPTWQSQSRHDWPRPIPRARSSARYANRAPLVSPFSSDATGPTVYFLTHNPLLPNRSLLFGPARCPSATLPKERKSCLSF